MSRSDRSQLETLQGELREVREQREQRVTDELEARKVAYRTRIASLESTIRELEARVATQVATRDRYNFAAWQGNVAPTAMVCTLVVGYGIFALLGFEKADPSVTAVVGGLLLALGAGLLRWGILRNRQNTSAWRQRILKE
ncbi:MAG: hypothetical protein QM817_34850 [Archangium sp.]